MLNLKQRRNASAVNAGSMADIAFLLLIFFLVTTTIEVDKGILAKLPPWSPDEEEPIKLPERRVFTIKINAANQLLVENEPMKLDDLREAVKLFITNPLHAENMPEEPKDAVVSLQNDRASAYEIYLLVYNELKGAYNEMRNEAAVKQFGLSFRELRKPDQEAIIEAYPMVISEAEPTKFEN